MNKPAFLVVGGDSLVGGGLFRALGQRGHKAYASTRRRESVGGNRVFLDFESEEPFQAPVDAGYAFIVAAATNYDRCEKDPLARVINVELTPQLVGGLLAQGLFVTFISTNSVFGGEKPWPNEDDAHDPQIPYAIQKHEAEIRVREIARDYNSEDRLNIVRLTKILDRSTSPLPNWFRDWQIGQPVVPFSDLIFAPMSVQFVGEALATIGERRVTGNFHLSGAENISYVTFAETLARAMGVSPSLISPSSATEKGVHIAFKPTYSGLGMRRTTNLTGIRPQSLDAVVSDLLAAN